MKKIITVFLISIVFLSIFMSNIHLSGASSPNHLLITEVLYDAPTNDATQEWVELFNPTTSPINTQGWTVSDNVDTFAIPTFTIPSNGYLILAKDASAFSALYGFQPNVSTMSLSLSNSGDELTLKDPSQNVVDFVAWENYVTGWSVSAVDTTIQRIKDLNQMPVDTDTGADWENSGTLGSPASGYGVIAPASNESTQVYFNDPIAGLPWMDNPTAQEGNLSTGIVSLLNSANVSIDAALYHLEWQGVITALVNAKIRGVTVRVAAFNDSITAGDFDTLISNGISVTGVTTPYIMHNKFFIIDSAIVWTGSYNPTNTGTLFNANDGVKITSTNVANIYQAEFDQLFADVYGTHKVDNNAEITTVNGEPFEVYFAPKDTGKTRLLDLINSANQSIYLSLFYMTDNDIFNALLGAYNRGVYIRAVYDYRGWRDQYAEAKQMIDLGLGVVDANPGVYHFKFGVFDSAIVWTGSTNWSGAGFSRNDENSIVIHDSNIAQQYIAKTLEYYNDAVNYDNSLTQAPRIVTHHYSSSPGSNFIEWRTHLNGNLPSNNVQKYLIWRWNATRNNFDLLQTVDYATGYYTDSTNIVTGTTYYYCISALINNQMTNCSAEFAQVAPGGTQPTLYPARTDLQYFGSDTTAPVVSILNPQPNSVVSGYLDIGLTAFDYSYLSQWQILVDNNLVSTSSLVNIDTTNLTDGVHIITGKVMDVFGNWGQLSITVTVNNTNHIPIANPTYSNLKILTYNVQESGLNPSWIDVIKEENPDVANLVETGNWDDIGNTSINQIVIDLNHNFPNELPYHAFTLQGMGSKYTGITLLSRFPIVQEKQIPIIQLDDGSYFQVSHEFLHAKLEIGTGTVNIIGAHLKATAGTSNEYKRERAQEGIINYMDTLGTQPIIYMGDFNSFSPYDTGALAPNGTLGDGPVSMLFGYGNYSQYAPTVQNFTDVFRTLNPTDPGYTYPQVPYTSRIDFIFTSNYFADKLLTSTVGDTPSASTGSDHYDVDVNMNLTAFGPVDTTPPSQVQGLTAQLNANNTVDLQWTANTEPDLYGYRIYRNNTLIAETTQTFYTDNSVSASNAYSYQVSAIDVNSNEGVKSTSATITIPSSAGSSVTKIVFAEVYYDTVGTDSIEEYIELYNLQSYVVDLSGWQIQDNYGTYIIPTGTTIQANGYIVIARNTAGFNALFGFNPDVSGLTLSLGNSGDKLTLFNTTGTQIDFVAWENYVAGWSITAKTGQVIKRISVLVDTDTVSDWMVTTPNPQ